ncbi:hypothetical protein BDSB_17155 [Burkholderia dolosa PC543]|nr:hypothetical protein BDSB_17155 [Burkholderia dolosa PC543]
MLGVEGGPSSVGAPPAIDHGLCVESRRRPMQRLQAIGS